MDRIMQSPGGGFDILKKAIDKPLALPILTTKEVIMNTSSTITRTFVKPKPENNVAFPNSPDFQLEILPADVNVKPSQIQDLQKPDPGARAGFLLKQLIKVPIPAGHKGTKIPGHYYLWAALDAYQGDDGECYPGQLTLAQNCRCSKRQIRRWQDKLESDRKIKIDRRGKFHRYRVECSRNITPFVFVDPRWVYRLGLSINQAVVLGYVKFRCNGKPEAWFLIRSAAADLGLSYNTIRRCLAVLAAWGFIEIRPGRLRGGRTNRYKLAPFGWMASWENYPKQARPKCPVKINTSLTESYSYANFSRKGGLSNQLKLGFSPKRDREAYGLLRNTWIHRKVAELIAAQWRDDPESVRWAIVNGMFAKQALERYWREQGRAPPYFNLAGYVIAALNGAHRECHGVRISKLARAFMAKAQGKAGPAAVGRVSDSVIEQRKKEEIRRLFTTPAKPHTPDNNAESALIKQNRNKEAEDALLTRTLETARRYWAASHKPANSPRKVDFWVDSCCRVGISV